MSTPESAHSLHQRLAEKGGPLGRLLFGIRVPLIYPLILLAVAAYAWFPPISEAPAPIVTEGPPAKAEVELVPRVADAPAMPEPLEPAELPEMPAEAPRPVAEPAPAAPPAKSTGTNGNADWLLSLPPEGYTLQLLGSRQEKVLRAFVRRHGLESMTAYYRTRHKGGQWYVLLYGLYADRDEASVAVGTLPAAVRKDAPFPRTVQSVQKAIREGR